MNFKLLLCLVVVLSGGLFASEAQTNSQPQDLTSVWRALYYPFPGAQEKSNRRPLFFLESGEQWGQISRGLRVEIKDIQQGFQFFDTNAIKARLYRANGEIVEPTAIGKRLLNVPIGVANESEFGEPPPPGVITYFPWGTNALEESWIEVSIAPERYWLEIPYGFDRNPADPLPPSMPGGPPRFVSAMSSLTQHDHVVRWACVLYDLGQTRDGRDVSLIQSYSGNPESQVELYRFPKPQDLYSPRTDVRLLEADGTAINGQCVNLHLDDGHLRRTDTFDFFADGANDLRCWGHIEVGVGDQTYRVSCPQAFINTCMDMPTNLRPPISFPPCALACPWQKSSGS